MDGGGRLNQLELEGSHDLGIPASSTDGPKQIGVPIRADPQHISSSGNDVGRDEAVNGETVLAHLPADDSASSIPVTRRTW